MEQAAEPEMSSNGDSAAQRLGALGRVDRDQVTRLLAERWREVAGWAAVLVGAVAGFLAWIGVSGKDIAPLQLPYLASGGIAAVVLTIFGVGLLVSADLQRDRKRLSRIEGELVELQDLVRALASEEAQQAPRPSSSRVARSR